MGNFTSGAQILGKTKWFSVPSTLAWIMLQELEQMMSVKEGDFRKEICWGLRGGYYLGSGWPLAVLMRFWNARVVKTWTKRPQVLLVIEYAYFNRSFYTFPLWHYWRLLKTSAKGLCRTQHSAGRNREKPQSRSFFRTPLSPIPPFWWWGLL